jgi:hypothetical protein
MHITAILLAAVIASAPVKEAAHAKNEVFSYVTVQGLEAGGKKVVLPKPRFSDGQSGEEQRRILVELAGSEEQLEAMMDNSPRAPNIFNRDETEANENAPVVRTTELWFVVYADLTRFDAASQVARIDGKSAESGQIKYECRVLKDADIGAAGITLGPQSAGQSTWFTLIHGELPNNVKFEVTDRGVATQTAESVVIATRTDPAFAKGKRPSNFWRKAGDDDGAGAGNERASAPHPYQGGISYTKVSRLGFKTGALIVEVHGAWVEPFEWFEGGGALSSKLKRAADEGIKKLREELAEGRAK